ncbi:MAG: hypothetical protein OTI35_07500, partial [Sulfitobacter sp.]|nr:hypothetical protein [Sulfitobacter sp.]
QLGYYGRCSLDAVICDHDNVGNSIHWIECNARWSGVSIPLAILDSIGVKSDESEMMILQERLPGGPIDTPSALKAMGDVLYSGAPSKEGVILMSPPMGAVSSTANLLVFAKFASDIEQIGNEAMQRLKLASM